MSRRRSHAFTLVELLVVIGIIAVLISILLPTLGRARAAAQTVACASNARQLALAVKLFAQERRGYMPAISDEEHVRYRDPTRSIWPWRKSASDPQPVVLDWASSLLPYLGVRGVEWFPYAPDNVSKLFKCPSDKWQEVSGEYGKTAGLQPSGPGLVIYNNVDPYTAGYPISYGINADIGCVTVADGIGRFGPGGDLMYVYAGTARPQAPPLNAKLDKVKRSAEVLLLADCGNRPLDASLNPNKGLERNDAVYYTSDTHGTAGGMAALKDDAGKLSGVQKAPRQAKRIPWDRHRNKINVVFVDGHGETIQKGDENKVRISPYQY
jgi:prepilin-type N-terminal cleavage/methylation domain-containing protein/prepilin-type processing-associated H-X9-DG protein